MGRRLVQSPKQLQSHGCDGDVSRQMSYGARAERPGHHGESLNPPPTAPCHGAIPLHAIRGEDQMEPEAWWGLHSRRWGGSGCHSSSESLAVPPPCSSNLHMPHHTLHAPTVCLPSCSFSVKPGSWMQPQGWMPGARSSEQRSTDQVPLRKRCSWSTLHSSILWWLDLIPAFPAPGTSTPVLCHFLFSLSQRIRVQSSFI